MLERDESLEVPESNSPRRRASSRDVDDAGVKGFFGFGLVAGPVGLDAAVPLCASFAGEPRASCSFRLELDDGSTILSVVSGVSLKSKVEREEDESLMSSLVGLTGLRAVGGPTLG